MEMTSVERDVGAIQLVSLYDYNPGTDDLKKYIKLYLPLVLMISATLYWNPLTMVRTYLPKLRAPITTDHN